MGCRVPGRRCLGQSRVGGDGSLQHAIAPGPAAVVDVEGAAKQDDTHALVNECGSVRNLAGSLLAEKSWKQAHKPSEYMPYFNLLHTPTIEDFE